MDVNTQNMSCWSPVLSNQSAAQQSVRWGKQCIFLTKQTRYLRVRWAMLKTCSSFSHCPLSKRGQGKFCIHQHYARVAVQYLSVHRDRTDWFTSKNDHNNQWYPSSCNIIWKQKFDTWTRFCFVLFCFIKVLLPWTWPQLRCKSANT